METAKQFQFIPCGISYELSPFEKIAILRKNSWLQNMDAAQLDSLCQYLSFVHIEKGNPIFRQGDSTPFMAIIQSGKIEILKEGHGGEAQIIAVIGAGHVIGEMSLIDGGARSATAIAAENSQIFVLTEESFEAIRKSHTALWGSILMRSIKTITRRLRRASGQFVDLLAENGMTCEQEIENNSENVPNQNETEADFLVRQVGSLNTQFDKLAKHILERATFLQNQPSSEVKIAPDVYEKLERHATYHKQSMSQHINQILEQHLNSFDS